MHDLNSNKKPLHRSLSRTNNVFQSNSISNSNKSARSESIGQRKQRNKSGGTLLMFDHQRESESHKLKNLNNIFMGYGTLTDSNN